MHQMIAKYYRMNPNDNNIFDIFYQRVLEEFKESTNRPQLEEIFKRFNNITNIQNATELLKDYTGEI